MLHYPHMKTLREVIADAEAQKKCIGHFNIANIEGLWAVWNAAQKVSAEAGEHIPVIIGTSEGERDHLGAQQIVNLVQDLREDNQYPIFINADHSYSVETATAAIDAGYDMVIIDLAEKGYDENLAATKAVVDYRNENDQHTLIEAELGFIGGGSNIKDEIPEGVSEASMTDPAEAKAFVEATGLDLLAPSVGNVHGMVKSGNPRLHPERISAVRESAGVPLVLHGGSGSSDEDFVAAIGAGISIIHISTELRVVYREALEKSLAENETLSPYKYMKPAQEAMQAAVEARMRLFWGL